MKKAKESKPAPRKTELCVNVKLSPAALRKVEGLATRLRKLAASFNMATEAMERFDEARGSFRLLPRIRSKGQRRRARIAGDDG